MRPLVAELERRGHQVVFTARDRTNTPELLDLYGFPYRKLGGEFRSGKLGKIIGTLGRAVLLYRSMNSEKPSVSFGHGSRALPIASRLMGVPSVTMYDYEWVDATLFNWGCSAILWPEAIDPSRCRETGVSMAKVRGYPGFKEELYLGGKELDNSIAADLGLREESIHVLLRPPATTAHYHNPEAEGILAAILQELASVSNLQLVFLPRTSEQRELPERAGVSQIIMPDRVYDGPSLVATMDMVISGGGTMTREAAIMGIPSYSFFRGRSGMVDETLARQGKLILLGTPDDVADKLVLKKRSGEIALPDPCRVVNFVVDQILEAAGHRNV